MKRTMLALALCALLGLSCGTKDETVKLRDWNFGGKPRMIEWLRQRVELFEQSHAGIRVEQSQKSWNMIRELLYADFSVGTGPDVVNVHANYAAEFGGAGYYYPINTFPDFKEVSSWYVPLLMESTRYKDNYYGLPSSGIAFVLVCNKELFDREGISPPRTWSEFREAARRLTKDTDGDGTVDQYGLVLLGGDKGGFAYRLIPFFLKAGAEVMSDDLKTIRFNSPAGLSALKLLADMYQVDHSITPGFLAYQLTEINDLFCSNKVAMSIEGPWFRGMVDDKSPGKKIYTVPVPVPDERIGVYDTAPTLQDMVMYAINARTKYPAQAWELIKFLRNEEADMAWIKEDLGALATTRHAIESREAKALDDLPMYINELKYAKPWPAHPSMIAIASDIFTPYTEKAIVGELSCQAALDMAAREAQDMIEGKK
ncbi:MAG TPA: sugar ABC transporter substrate-binding protein [Bacteroidota bacterium]|nr:sugar ABC transporter substrate-binding protein [Bacteroidota bacterium]